MTRAFGAYCSLTIFRFCQKEAGVFVRSSKNSRRLREKIDILTKSVILDKKGQVSGKGNGRMLITRELDYAIRTLRALHRHGQLSAAAVAELEHMPKAITLKTLSRLHGAGIVESRASAAKADPQRRSSSDHHITIPRFTSSMNRK